MDTKERTETMDRIAAAGDATVLRFASHCMALLEENGEVTAEDAQSFARKLGLL